MDCPGGRGDPQRGGLSRCAQPTSPRLLLELIVTQVCCPVFCCQHREKALAARWRRLARRLDANRFRGVYRPGFRLGGDKVPTGGTPVGRGHRDTLGGGDGGRLGSAITGSECRRTARGAAPAQRRAGPYGRLNARQASGARECRGPARPTPRRQPGPRLTSGRETAGEEVPAEGGSGPGGSGREAKAREGRGDQAGVAGAGLPGSGGGQRREDTARPGVSARPGIIDADHVAPSGWPDVLRRQ